MKSKSADSLAYSIGFLFSLFLHLTGAVVAVMVFEHRAATASRAPEVFTVTLEGGERLGGITQVPKDDAKKSKAPKLDVVPEEPEEDVADPIEEESAETKAAALEAKKAAEALALEETRKKEKKEAERKKKEEEKRKAQEAKKKVDQARKKKEQEKKKKADEKRRADKARRDRNRRLSAISKRLKTKYEGESANAGGTGFGAARIGGSGMGGGTLASVEKIAYQNQLQKHVKSGWRWLPGSKKMRALVRVKILPDGQIQDIRIEQSSGNSNFDDSVVRAVRKAAPVPPPPSKFYSEFRDVRFWFDSHEQ